MKLGYRFPKCVLKSSRTLVPELNVFYNSGKDGHIMFVWGKWPEMCWSLDETNKIKIFQNTSVCKQSCSQTEGLMN